MELWDAYDVEFNKLDGITLIRGEESTFSDGIFHLVCDILVRHMDGTYLLMQRDMQKHFPGMWEATAGGSALQGETPSMCAHRELKEETGIIASELKEVGRIADKEKHSIYVEYLCITDWDKNAIRLQEGETIDYKWVSKSELMAMGEDELVTYRMQQFIEDLNMAVIFDLDGTLWDSTGCACDIWNRVLEKHDDISFRMTKEKAEHLMGKTMEDIGLILFPNLSAQARNAIVDEFGDEEVAYLTENGAVLYEGLEEVLKILGKNHKLYIVSNCQDGYVPAFLHAHKLGEYFADIEMSGRTGLDKGNNIKLIMERNHIKSAVYIGDTEGDEKAARFAGIPFIYAEYGFGKAVSPDAVITDIRELTEVVANW